MTPPGKQAQVDYRIRSPVPDLCAIPTLRFTTQQKFFPQ
jgi:hypothetical protein